MRAQRGFAMNWALFLLMLVGAAGAVMLERGQTLRRDGDTDLRALAALHAAEGGLARAQHALLRDASWTGERARIGSCSVDVVVRADGDARWSVTSRAEPGAAHLEGRLALRDGRVEVVDWTQRP